MKIILRLLFIFAFSGGVNAAGLLNMEIDQIQQYGADALTIIYFKSEYISPNNCTNSTWGKKAVLVRSASPHAEKMLSVALAAMMANKKVDVGLLNSCDAATEGVHYIRVKN
jgi:hypothetical protein